MTGIDEVTWAPRISKEKIRRLYISDAQGMLDEDLLADVGTRLFQRCRSIIEIEEARQGRVRCPRCSRAGRETVIERSKEPGAREAQIVCPACGWQVTWIEYARTFKRRQLNSGGAMKAFQEYILNWPAARTPEAKMAAVDRLIHAFHYSLYKLPGLPTRPAGVNLIKGKLGDVIQFLEELSYGTGSPPARGQVWQEWQRTLEAFRTDFLGGLMSRRSEKDQTDDPIY